MNKFVILFFIDVFRFFSDIYFLYDEEVFNLDFLIFEKEGNLESNCVLLFCNNGVIIL